MKTWARTDPPQPEQSIESAIKENYCDLHRKLSRNSSRIHLITIYKIIDYVNMEANGHHEESLKDGLAVGELFEKGEGLTYKWVQFYSAADTILQSTSSSGNVIT